MNKFESASIIAGLFPNSEEQATAPTNVHMITGESVGKSEDGKALINMDGVVFSGDDSQYVEVNALGGLEDGDTAAILLSGESGRAMAPFAIGSIGSVDRVRDLSENAMVLAEEADAVAQATGQYFWHNTGEEEDPIEADIDGGTGAHVTQFKREEWSNPESENYHSGPNSLWNSLGMLFRNGLNNLLAIVTGINPGLAIYDGQGNNSENIVAYYSSDGQRIGRSDDFHSMQDDKSFGLYLANDRLVNFSSDGLLTSVYMGGSTLAPGATYTDAQVQALLTALKDGCYVSETVKIYDKNNTDTGMRIVLPFNTLGQADVSDRFGVVIKSGKNVLFYSNGSSYAQGFGLDPILTPASEVAGAPVNIDMGNTSISAQNGSLSVNVGKNITVVANQSGSRLGYTAIALNNTSSGTNSIDLRSKTVSLTNSANFDSKSFTMQEIIDVLTKALPVQLFKGTYSETYNKSVTLSESVDNFSRICIEWRTSDGANGSTMLDMDVATVTDAATGRTGRVAAAVAINNNVGATSAYIKSKLFFVSGTTISNWTRTISSSTVYQRSEATVKNNAATTITNNELIGITKVLGWR